MSVSVPVGSTKACATGILMIRELGSEAKFSYWDGFYSKNTDSIADSHTNFADFVSKVMTCRSKIFEFGCGNGRDSLFFARLGHDVTALDSSCAAIIGVNARIIELGLTNIRCVNAKVQEDVSAAQLCAVAQACADPGPMPVVVYARFFLHALTEAEQAAFLAIAVELLEGDGLLAVEFRTCQDRMAVKTTPPHYRRYIDPDTFIRDVAPLGLRPRYYRQGKGLAVHGVDDAHVARIIFEAGKGAETGPSGAREAGIAS